MAYDISSKTLIGAEPLRITFHKVDGFIRIYNAIRCLLLFGPEKYHVIYDKTRYLISHKIGITYIISDYFVRTKIDSYDSLPLEATLTLLNFAIVIK